MGNNIRRFKWRIFHIDIMPFYNRFFSEIYLNKPLFRVLKSWGTKISNIYSQRYFLKKTTMNDSNSTCNLEHMAQGSCNTWWHIWPIPSATSTSTAAYKVPLKRVIISLYFWWECLVCVHLQLHSVYTSMVFCFL